MYPLSRLLAAGTFLLGAPDVPTMAEAGAPGDQISDVMSDVMQAMFAPTGTPRSIIDPLQKEVARRWPRQTSSRSSIRSDSRQSPTHLNISPHA